MREREARILVKYFGNVIVPNERSTYSHIYIYIYIHSNIYNVTNTTTTIVYTTIIIIIIKQLTK